MVQFPRGAFTPGDIATLSSGLCVSNGLFVFLCLRLRVLSESDECYYKLVWENCTGKSGSGLASARPGGVLRINGWRSGVFDGIILFLK